MSLIHVVLKKPSNQFEQADIDGKHSEGLTDCDRTSEEPTCIQYSDDIDDDPFNIPQPLSPLDVQL